MGLQYSYVSYEKDFAHELREKLNHSEDGSDVYNMFSFVIAKMLNRIFGEKLKVKNNDITFEPDCSTHFSFSRKLLDSDIFTDQLANSDIGNIVNRFAESAYNRYVHINKHLKKTNLKVRN